MKVRGVDLFMKSTLDVQILAYRKISKINPGAYISSKALFEGPIFGGAFLRTGREICVAKPIGLAL